MDSERIFLTQRLSAAQTQLESGNWYVPHPMLVPRIVEYIGECAAFPAGAMMIRYTPGARAKRLLRIKAKPPAPNPRLYYGSIGTSDQFLDDLRQVTVENESIKTIITIL